MAQACLDQLKPKSLLFQLRVVELFARSCSLTPPSNNTFPACMTQTQEMLSMTRWLAERLGPIGQHHLSREANNFRDVLVQHHVLGADVPPAITASVLPWRIQAAYILCLAGHACPKSLPQFAASVMQRILLDVQQAAQAFSSKISKQGFSQAKVLSTACNSLDLVASFLQAHGLQVPSTILSSHSPATQHHAPSQPALSQASFDLSDVIRRVQGVSVKVR